MKQLKYEFAPTFTSHLPFMNGEFHTFLRNNQIKYTYENNGCYLIHLEKDLNYILLVFSDVFEMRSSIFNNIKCYYVKEDYEKL